MSSKTATLQLCIHKRCPTVQLFYIDYAPELLKDPGESPDFTFIGVEVDGDVDKLRVEYGLECAKHADVRELVKLRWPGRFRKPGLKDLALEVVGLVMDKPKHVSMSNWEARVLNVNQVEYACIDAYASYELGVSLLKKLSYGTVSKIALCLSKCRPMEFVQCLERCFVGSSSY